MSIRGDGPVDVSMKEEAKAKRSGKW